MAIQQSNEPRGFNLPFVLIVVVVSWALWGAGVAVLFRLDLSSPESWSKAGQLGDLFGGINALATGLAFSLVWWTGHMQRRDLALQMEELKLQRDELRQTREVFKRQIFESSFFHQIELFREISASAIIFGRVGDDAMQHTANECRAILSISRLPPDGGVNTINYCDYVDQRYKMDIYDGYSASLGPYFRTLYHLFKMIDARDDLSVDEKIEHANLARAQLGTDALILLATNVVSSLGANFVPLVVRYGLLKHLPREDWYSRVEGVLGAEAFLGSDERSALRSQAD